jgi:hypothetical protein
MGSDGCWKCCLVWFLVNFYLWSHWNANFLIPHSCSLLCHDQAWLWHRAWDQCCQLQCSKVDPQKYLHVGAFWTGCFRVCWTPSWDLSNIPHLMCMCYERVKESCYRPGVAQRVPGGLGSQISRHSVREDGEDVSLMHRVPLPPGMFLVLIFTRDWVDARAMVRLEGMSLKNPVTPPGIDPGTIRLVAQSLNHYATPGPCMYYTCKTNCLDSNVH